MVHDYNDIKCPAQEINGERRYVCSLLEVGVWGGQRGKRVIAEEYRILGGDENIQTLILVMILIAMRIY
jgi:hypothetical protein